MSEVAAGETKPVRPWSMRRGRQEGASSNQLLGTEGAPLGVDAAEVSTLATSPECARAHAL